MKNKEITVEFIKSEIEKLGLSRKEVCEDLGISKFKLSDLLSENGRNPLSTKFQKSAFRYYFLYKRSLIQD